MEIQWTNPSDQVLDITIYDAAGMNVLDVWEDISYDDSVWFDHETNRVKITKRNGNPESWWIYSPQMGWYPTTAVIGANHMPPLPPLSPPVPTGVTPAPPATIGYKYGGRKEEHSKKDLDWFSESEE